VTLAANDGVAWTSGWTVLSTQMVMLVQMQGKRQYLPMMPLPKKWRWRAVHGRHISLYLILAMVEATNANSQQPQAGTISFKLELQCGG
jgi:hypothetical protein